MKIVAMSAPFLLLMSASQLSAEPLYLEFAEGAAKEQVLSKFPNAKLDEPNSKGDVLAYRLEDYPAKDMWTYFTFQADGLSKVKFYGRGAAKYLEIVSSLKAKYGTPDTENTAAESGVTIWRRGSTTIKAQLESSYSTVVGRVTEPFSVTYEPSESSLDAVL